MASESLQFNSDPITLLSTGALAGNYSGTLNVDYSTGAVTGSITTSPTLGSSLPVLTYQNFSETYDPATDLYTLSSKDGILGLGATTFSITYSGAAPSTSTSSLALLGTVPTFGGSADAVVSGPAVCFADGTLIRTVRDGTIVDVEVGDLAIGDLVVTASGAHRPIRWLGHRTIDEPSFDQRPVRVRAGAFGPDLPARDLRLSSGHPVLVDADAAGEGGVLVPIMCLINGTTIERMPAASVTYWHVELDAHDILLAEGLPAESYIDLGSRPWFAGADGTLYDPDLARAGAPGRCRPVAIGGPVVEIERRRLDAVFSISLTAACRWHELGSLAL